MLLYVKDWTKLVHILLYFVLADQEKLGYDQSVQYVTRDKDNNPVWDYTVSNLTGSRVFRTISCISD